VNAVAAYERYKRCLIVVDFGTATTFDYVSAKGEYFGGAIAPALALLQRRYLFEPLNFPELRLLNRNGHRKDHNPEHAIRDFYGYVGLVDEIVKRMKKETSRIPR
jgi:type III pantothenate kinase